MVEKTKSRSQVKFFVSLANARGAFCGVALLLSLWACASAPKAVVDLPTPARVEMTLEERWGIELEPIRLTAAGYMIDFRYRVIDPEKAAPLLSRNIRRYVMVEKSKAILQVPSTEKLGALRSAVSTPEMVKKDRIYAALFANPGRHVKTGDRITVVLGEFKAENLVVN